MDKTTTAAAVGGAAAVEGVKFVMWTSLQQFVVYPGRLSTLYHM